MTTTITDADATFLAEAKALNLTPAEIRTALNEKAELEAGQRRGVITAAAAALDLNADVLADQLERLGMLVEFKGGSPHVRKAADPKAALEPLESFVERDLKKYLPALHALDDEALEDDGEEKSADVADDDESPEYPEQQGGKPRAKRAPTHAQLVEAARALPENNWF